MRTFSRLFGPVNLAHGLVVATVLSLLLVTPAVGQLTSPGLTTSSTSTRTISAAEAAHHVNVKEGRLQDAGYSIRTPDYPRDSMQRVVMETGTKWLERIR